MFVRVQCYGSLRVYKETGSVTTNLSSFVRVPASADHACQHAVLIVVADKAHEVCAGLHSGQPTQLRAASHWDGGVGGAHQVAYHVGQSIADDGTQIRKGGVGVR